MDDLELVRRLRVHSQWAIREAARLSRIERGSESRDRMAEAKDLRAAADRIEELTRLADCPIVEPVLQSYLERAKETTIPEGESQ